MASRRVNGTCRPMRITTMKRRSTHCPIKLNNATIKEKRTKAKNSNQYFATWEPEPLQWHGFLKKRLSPLLLKISIKERDTGKKLGPLSSPRGGVRCLPPPNWPAAIAKTNVAQKHMALDSHPMRTRKFIRTCFPETTRDKLNCNSLYHLRTLRLTEPGRTQFGGRIILASHEFDTASISFTHLTHPPPIKQRAPAGEIADI